MEAATTVFTIASALTSGILLFKMKDRVRSPFRRNLALILPF